MNEKQSYTGLSKPNLLTKDKINRSKSNFSKMLDLSIFVAPLLQFIDINIIGHLYGTDLVFLILFPYALSRFATLVSNKFSRKFLLLGLLWLISQVLTDIVRGTPLVDFSRGWSKIIFSIVSFCVIFVLVKDRKYRIVLLAIGFAIGRILVYFFNPSIYASGSPWKFGIGPSITLFVVLLATWSYKKNKDSFFIAAIFLIAAFLNLFQDYRSLAGICILSAGYVLSQSFIKIGSISNQKRQISKILILILLFVLGFGFISLYENLAQQGLLGEYEKSKYEMQSLGAYGVLLGGRSEILVSAQAILKSPIIGYGSWAKDWDLIDLYVSTMRKFNYWVHVNPDAEGLIPTHSHLFGSWVEAGLLGGIFWLWVLSIPIGFLMGPSKKQPLFPLIVFFSILLIWDILFSPYGAERRFVTPFYIISIMVSLPNFNTRK